MTQPDRLYDAPEAKDALALTRMWGATSKLSFTGLTPVGGVTLQLADIRLPEPVTASIYFQATRAGGAGTVQSLTLELFLGLGRTNVMRPSTFLLQPTFGAPVIFTLPMQPIATILARVIGTGFASGSEPVEVDCTLEVAPITRIHYEKEALKFGMALPGEADEAEHALREDLEEYAPGVRAIMAANPGADPHAYEQQEHDDDDGDDDPPPRKGRPQIVVPKQFEPLIKQLSVRLGRPAKVADLSPNMRKRLLRAVKRTQ